VSLPRTTPTKGVAAISSAVSELDNRSSASLTRNHGKATSTAVYKAIHLQ